MGGPPYTAQTNWRELPPAQRRPIVGKIIPINA